MIVVLTSYFFNSVTFFRLFTSFAESFVLDVEFEVHADNMTITESIMPNNRFFLEVILGSLFFVVYKKSITERLLSKKVVFFSVKMGAALSSWKV